MYARKLRASALHVKRTAGNLVRARILERQHTLPHFAVYHANYRCNAACSFCSREIDIANEEGVRRDISTEKIEMIFRQLRRVVASLYIAGGEPLLEKDIEQMLAFARDIGFYPLAINTNATLLDKRPDVPRFADMTVVSIHATDVSAAASIFKIKGGLAERMFENIIEAAETARRFGNQVIGNCVLTNQNIESAYSVLDFCLKHRIPLAIVPAIEEYRPSIGDAGIEVIEQYQAFVDRVIEEKCRNKDTIASSWRFLVRARELRSFDCRPTGMLSVDPEGRIINPCDHRFPDLPKHLGQVDQRASILSVLGQHLRQSASFSACDKNCLKSCYAEPALAIEDPLGMLQEYLVW